MANFDTSITIRAGVEGISDLNQLMDVIEQAGGDVSQLREQTQRLGDTWHTLTPDEQTRQINELATATQGLARDTNRATDQMERFLGVRSNNAINAEINQVNTALGTLHSRLEAGTISQEEFNRMSQAGQNRLNALQGELNQTSTSLNRVDDNAKKASVGMEGLGGAFNKFQGLLATLGVSVGAMELIQLADQFKTLEAKVKLATGEGANFVTGFEGVKQIADRTFTSVEDTGELFSRIARAGEAMNLAQKDTLQITESINQAIKLSGGSAESNQAAITQLIQGLQSGTVRGEEFNSIMEQAPRLAQAMADGLGVTRGQLREMAADGKLTSETVIKAVQSQSSAIQSEFDKLPLTTGDALTQLKNNFMLFVGDIDKQINGSSGIATTIQNIANGFNDIDISTTDAVREAFSQLGELAKELWTGLSNGLDTLGSLWNAFDGSTAAGEKVGVLTKVVQELSIFIGHITDGVKAMQIASDVAAGGMILGVGKIRQAYEELMGKSHEVSNSLISKGEEMLSRAQKSALEYESAAVKAANEAAKTQQQRLNEAALSAENAYVRMKEAGKESAEKQQEAAIDAANAIVAANKGVLDEKAKAILAEQGLQGEIDKTGKLQVNQLDATKKSFLETANEGKKAGIGFWDSLTDATKKAKTEQDLVDIRASLEVMKKSGEITTAQLDAGMKLVVQRHKELDVELQENIESFADVAKAAIDSGDKQKIAEMEKQAAAKGLKVIYDDQKNIMISAADAAKQTASDIKKDYGTLTTSLGLDFEKASIKVNDSFSKMNDGVLKIAGDFNKFKEVGIDASLLVEQGITKMIASAKNKADFDLLNTTIKQMGDEGKLSGDQVKQALEDSKKKATELQIGISDVEKAYKSMGIASQAELAKKAADYEQAYDQIAKDATATNEIKKQAYEKYAQAAIDANNGVLTSEVKTQAAARGYADVVVENGKVSTKTAEEIAQANKKSEESHKKVTQSTKEQGDAAKEAAEKGKQAAENQEKSNSGILDAIAKMYDNFTSSIAKGLQNVGVSGEQSIQIMKNALRGQAYMINSWTGFFQGFANARERVKASIDAFNEVRNSAIGMTQTLNSATVTTNDLGMAQLVLNRATTSTVDGIVKMDNTTLDNLKRQIDSTKQKFDDLSKSAKDTADGLQTQLARLKGDDTTARQLEQTKKLTDLQEKLNEARKRGNTEEIAQLQRAFDLQKQINDEENRQASVKLQQEQQAKQANAQKQAQANSSYNQPVQSTSSNTQSVNAKDVANSFADLIEQAKKEGANLLAQQLMDEAKRLAR